MGPGRSIFMITYGAEKYRRTWPCTKVLGVNWSTIIRSTEPTHCVGQRPESIVIINLGNVDAWKQIGHIRCDTDAWDVISSDASCGQSIIVFSSIASR